MVGLRLERQGREHAPADGPVIYAANHRSLLDPIVIGVTVPGPVYYVAKQELFAHRAIAWLISSLGAFPVRRGEADADMVQTARAILARGDAVLFFPEGTRTRSGPPKRARRGVGRLALETGAPVVPVSILGTEHLFTRRRPWLPALRIALGEPRRFPREDKPDQAATAAATDRIWPDVLAGWERLGGAPTAPTTAADPVVPAPSATPG